MGLLFTPRKGMISLAVSQRPEGMYEVHFEHARVQMGKNDAFAQKSKSDLTKCNRFNFFWRKIGDRVPNVGVTGRFETEAAIA